MICFAKKKLHWSILTSYRNSVCFQILSNRRKKKRSRWHIWIFKRFLFGLSSAPWVLVAVIYWQASFILAWAHWYGPTVRLLGDLGSETSFLSLFLSSPSITLSLRRQTGILIHCNSLKSIKFWTHLLFFYDWTSKRTALKMSQKSHPYEECKHHQMFCVAFLPNSTDYWPRLFVVLMKKLVSIIPIQYLL